MQMHLIIAVFFAITVVIAFLEDYLKELQKIVILAVYAVFMIVLATTKDVDHTADGPIYEQIFYNNDDLLTELTTEPTYLYISRMILAMGGTLTVLLFIYAVITIPAKLRAFYLLTPYIFTALIVYIPMYFELHDLIQIRAAAASTFILTSLLPLVNKKYRIAGLLMVIAIFFHYSS